MNNIHIMQSQKDLDNYFYVKYWLESATILYDAAFETYYV